MQAIIVDIDGTLLNGSRGIQKTIDYVNERKGKFYIALITGRLESDRRRTLVALRSAGVKFNSLTMNPSSLQNSNAYKKDAGQKLLSRMGVALAIDNNPDARRAYSSLGIKTMDPATIPSITGPTKLSRSGLVK